MTFNYYFGSQAEQFSFVRIPRIMLTEPAFQELSLASKVLYGVLLDRMSLSMKNNWFDDEDRVYIIYQIGEIQEDLGLTKRKAMDLLSELEDFGLLEKKRRGHGLPNILYVKSFMTDTVTDHPSNISEGRSMPEALPAKTEDRGTEMRTSDSDEQGASGTEICTSRSAGFRTQEVQESALQEVQDSAPLMNQTDKNHTYRNQTDSNHIVSASLAERIQRL